MAKKLEPAPQRVFYYTVEELIAHLQTLDPKMPLCNKESAGMFAPGIECDEMRLKKFLADPTLAVTEDDRIFKKTEFGPVFDALWIN